MKPIRFAPSHAVSAALAALCIPLAMLCTISPARAADATVNQALAAAASATVRVNNVAGAIHVQGWNQNRVQVTGTLSGQATLDFHGGGNNVEVRVVYPNYGGGNSQADLTVQVPAASRLIVNTVSAGIDADGLNGSGHLESVSGDVTLNSRDTDAELKSVSGDVTVTGSAKGAHVSGRSVSGDVRISGIDGNVDAGSISGAVNVSGSRIDRAKLNSTSGNVNFTAALAPSGNYDFNSTSGNLTLSFSAKPDARFDIYTFSGDIDNNFGPKAQRTSEYGPGRELHFSSGAGGAQVSAHTLSGNITLRSP
ncbi:MAG: DUF4097 family beta strand repeat-containing protein [Gammaproteobacteria bacterium]